MHRGAFLTSTSSALLLASCARPRSSARIVFAYVPVLAAAPAMIAQERGFFADAGLDVEMIAIATAQDAIALLARGRLDVAVGGISAAFFNARHRGFNVRLASGVTYIPRRGRPTALMVRKDLYDEGLRTPQQLRGHRVGIIGGLGTSSSYYLGEMVRPLTFGDMDLIPLNGGDQGVALRRKSIAAAFAWNPFTQAFERNGLAVVVALPGLDTSTSGMLYGEHLLDRPELGKRVFDAMNRAVVAIAGDGYYDAANMAAMAKYIGQPAATLAKDDRYTYKPGMPIDRRTLDAMQRLFIVEKTLAYPTPVPDAQLVVSYSS